MKHLLYASFAVCIALFSGCSDQEVVGPDAGQEEQPGVKVSLSIEGDMGGQSGSPKAEGPSSRAIGYQTIATDGHAEGFPTPIGIFDKSGDDGKELEDGTKVPVVLIFRNSDDSQPITKVVTNWTYKKGGKLSLETNERFELKAGSNLSAGTWYVCGILGGEQLLGTDQVKFNGYSEGHTPRTSTGEVATWGANVPYIFSWRKLETNAANGTFEAKLPVRFKQFGTIVRLKVSNGTHFDFKYNGVRIITSNILCGQFDLSAFDDKNFVKSSELHDVTDTEIASAKLDSYKSAFKAFKFYQRPLTDNAMTAADGLIVKRRFRIKGDYIANFAEEKSNKLNTALYYYDHTFLPRTGGDNFDKVVKGKEASSFIYVWMCPQEQDVLIYKGNKEGVGSADTMHIAKTQFLLMAEPDGNGTSGMVVPKSINMIPAYGTRTSYLSGANYPAKGKVVYEFPPLSYIAKHDNFGTDAQLSTDVNQDVPHTTRYKYSEVESNLSTIPSDYMMAGHEYWRSIIPQGYGFAGLRSQPGGAPYYNFSMGVISPARLPGWPATKLVYQSSSKRVEANGKKIAYMLNMSKKPDYITNDDEGQVYQGFAKQPAASVSSGMTGLSWIDTNKYRYVMRWEDDQSNKLAVITQRYLGPRFVLDMDDITTEDFWAAPDNYGHVYPADVKRIIPLGGGYIFKTFHSNSLNTGLFYWYLTDPGHSAQYWTPDDAIPGGRYAFQGTIVRDSDNNVPKLVVGFRMPDLGGDVGSFFYYGYKGVPLNQERPLSDVGSKDGGEYVQNLRMQIPVRLWRKTTPYAD